VEEYREEYMEFLKVTRGVEVGGEGLGRARGSFLAK